MPNWCTNGLQVSGSKEAMDKWRKVLATEDNIGEPILTFDKLLPLPESEKDNWHAWRNEHWGTKWDIDGDESQPISYDEVYAEYDFPTAWGPPVALFENISKDFPGITFSLAYYEPGMCFAGWVKWLDGEVIHDELHRDRDYAQFVADYFGDDYYLEQWDEEEEENGD